MSQLIPTDQKLCPAHFGLRKCTIEKCCNTLPWFIFNTKREKKYVNDTVFDHSNIEILGNVEHLF